MGTAVFASSGPTPFKHNALSGFDAILPHASPSLDLPDELWCRLQGTVATNDWTMAQPSVTRYLYGAELTVSEPLILSGSFYFLSRCQVMLNDSPAIEVKGCIWEKKKIYISASIIIDGSPCTTWPRSTRFQGVERVSCTTCPSFEYEPGAKQTADHCS